MSTRHLQKMRWRVLHLGLNAGLLVSLLCVILGWYWRSEPIPLNEVLPQLQGEPLQLPTDKGPFTFEYEGQDYEVEPTAKYSIVGLVVSHNDITSIADIYHNSSSVDVRDICMIWGDNVATDVFHDMRFWSEPWTCWAQYRHERADDFNPEQLSNNHILTPDLDLRDLLFTVHRGDQIEMKGYLVNYAPSDRPDMKRKSSLTRKDTGQGACEVFFVTDLGILKRGNWEGHMVYFWSVMSLIGLACLKVIAHFLTPLRLVIGGR